MAMASKGGNEFVVLGAGVIGLSTALTLRETYPSSTITVVAKHFPGDRSIEYASPWAGANWSSMATDSGPLEGYDRVTFNRFARMVGSGLGSSVGLGRMGLRAIFDAEIEQVGVLSEGTGKLWYEELVGGMRFLEKGELPEGAVFGLDFKSTFRLNTQVYLNWYVYPSIVFLSWILYGCRIIREIDCWCGIGYNSRSSRRTSRLSDGIIRPSKRF
jgi:D-amino-acid oxidase